MRVRLASWQIIPSPAARSNGIRSLNYRLVSSILNGSIVFNDKISELRALLDEINEYSSQYGFPLVVVDQQSRSGLKAWIPNGIEKRSLQKPEETRVKEF